MPSVKPSLLRIVLGALAMIWYYRTNLAKALVLPFLFLIALNSLKLLEPPLYVTLALLLPKFAILTIFAITTHRIILLGKDSVPNWGLRRWTKRESFFAIHLAALSFLSGILVILPAMGMLLLSHLIWPYIGLVVGLVVATYLSSRLSLVFPGSAIDQGVTFGESWRLSRRHQLLMIGVIAIVPILFWIPTSILPESTYTFFFSSILDTLFSVMVIGCLSLAYQEISRIEYEN